MKQIISFYKHYKAMYGFILVQAIIFILLFLSLGIENKSLNMSIYFCILLLCMASYIILYKIYKNISEHIEIETEAELLQKQQQMQAEHLLATNKTRDHLYECKVEIMQELKKENIHVQNVEEAKMKASELMEKYANLYEIDFCKNKVIDAILYNKVITAKSKSVKTSIQMILPEHLEIKDIDLMFLFTNLLDNAIEACEKLPKGSRFIDVEGMIKANYLSIRVSNSKDASVYLDNKTILTTKDDKENHGIGISIIQHVCKQYHGKMKIEDHGKYVDIYTTLELLKTL